MSLALSVEAAAQSSPQNAGEPSAGDEIVVSDERRDSSLDSSISRLTQPLLDTPQSISTVTSFELRSRAVSDVNDALRTVPGVTLGAGEFSWQGNSPTIRGFVARSDLFLDGMRDFGNYYRDPFNLAQLEILQGPSSIYFGRGSTGGVINQTSKRPEAAPSIDVRLAAGTNETYRATADVNQPIGEVAAFRLNAMAHRNEVAGRDAGEYRRYGAAPSLALEFGAPTRVSASYLRQEEDNVPDYGLPWYFGRPAPVDRSNFYGFRDDHLDTRVDVATLRVEHDASSNVTVRNQLRYARYARDFRITEPVLAAGATPQTPFDAVRVSRNIWSGESQETFLQNQLDMIARFKTGALAHTLVAGVEAGRETSAPGFENSLGVPTESLVAPDPSRPFESDVTFIRLAADTEATSLAFFAVDTVQLAPRWEATLGVRWDRFDADYQSSSFSPAGALVSTATIPQTDAAASVRAALVYKPAEKANVYVAFGTSFNPSAENLTQITSGRALGTGSANLDPEKNRSYEFGAKGEVPGSEIIVSAAVFRLEKTNARVPDLANPGFNMLGGAQRVDGFQAQVSGDLAEGWYTSVGYTYLDSEVTKSVPGAAPVGRPLINAPEHSASFLTEYRVTDAFTFGASLTYLSERLAQNAGATPLVAPGFVTADLMARFALTPKVSAQINVFNIADAYYFDQLHPFHVVPGPGRSALVTLAVEY